MESIIGELQEIFARHGAGAALSAKAVFKPTRCFSLTPAQATVSRWRRIGRKALLTSQESATGAPVRGSIGM